MTIVAECSLFCGDIAVNPGPINFSEIQRHKGLGYVIGIYNGLRMRSLKKFH